MTFSRYATSLPALGLGLALTLQASFSPTARAQTPASGSGSGTGTGSAAGSAGSTGTGSESGSGLGTTSGRGQRPGAGTRPTGAGGQVPSSGPRPEPMLQPRRVDPGAANDLFGTGETPSLIQDARRISDPGERSLAMVRIARTSIFLGRPDIGHVALFSAAADSKLETDTTLRDQRLVNVINAALALAEEHMRDIAVIQGNAADTLTPLPSPVNIDRSSNFERGRQEWDLAFDLCSEIDNNSARTEALYRVVESQSLGSNSLVREPFRLKGETPDPAKLPGETRDFANGLLASAVNHAVQIDRPVMRDRSLVAIASNAAASGQFDRALEAARAIPQPEVRTDGLLRVAEDLAVFGKNDLATATYEETARTIAMIPQADPRETLVGVLIDSMIAFGRFEDARKATVLYSNPANPPIALAAVAESQGRRGLADSARAWIDAEPSAELRSHLYRKLNEGVLASIEQRRSSELNRGGP